MAKPTRRSTLMYRCASAQQKQLIAAKVALALADQLIAVYAPRSSERAGAYAKAFKRVMGRPSVMEAE